MSMKSADEIKKGLECCTSPINVCHNKTNCPYFASFTPCARAVPADALALIQQLQAENAEQADRIQQLEAERDALINDIRAEGGLCALCKHEGARAWAEPCCRCYALIISGESHWEWRGVQKEE